MKTIPEEKQHTTNRHWQAVLEFGIEDESMSSIIETKDSRILFEVMP